MRLGTVWALALSLNMACALAQERSEFSCPATLAVSEQPEAPAGWSAAPGRNHRELKTAKVYNGKAGGQEYDLAPDDTRTHGRRLTLSWNLKDYRQMNLFVRCFYHDTEATIHADLPARLTSCSLIWR